MTTKTKAEAEVKESKNVESSTQWELLNTVLVTKQSSTNRQTAEGMVPRDYGKPLAYIMINRAEKGAKPIAMLPEEAALKVLLDSPADVERATGINVQVVGHTNPRTGKVTPQLRGKGIAIQGPEFIIHNGKDYFTTGDGKDIARTEALSEAIKRVRTAGRSGGGGAKSSKPKYSADDLRKLVAAKN